MTTPNILLVMADQLAPHFTGTYGHPLVETPAMDGVAERGMRFDNTYCHSPLCAPARFSLLSGQPISAIGAWDNAAELPASVPTVAHYLRTAGYRTSLAGKMHFVGPDQLHGFEERLTTDIYPADFAWTPNWDRADERIDKWYHGMDSLREAGRAMATYQLDYDDEVGFKARRRLYDFARDLDRRPFFLVASFIHPHDPYVARPEWWDRYDHDLIDLPDEPDPATLDPHTRRIRRGIQVDSVGYSEAEARNARHGYYANTSYFDHWLGRLIDALGETDQLDRTVVIVTSDHGDMLGDRGTWFKMSFHERSARVPLLVAGPGIATGTCADVTGHLDLAPTLLDLATDGGRWPELGADLAGHSLMDVAAGGRHDRDEAIGEYTGELTAHPMFMIRRGRHKYIHCDGDPPLLYDVVDDPLERCNLATDPASTELAAGFAAEVDERWDRPGIRRRVVASQRARRAVDAAMTTGPLTSWDYGPPVDPANSYVRNHLDWNRIGPRTRFPPIG